MLIFFYLFFLAELTADLKQATQLKDLLALLQVYAEGLDLATPLPQMVGAHFIM